MLQAANAEVRSSQQLRSVLKIVLAVGNFLNAGGRNSGAAGFQLEVLLKLKEVNSLRRSMPEVSGLMPVHLWLVHVAFLTPHWAVDCR